jgi:thiol-disulfide isomerase/thioredoxin
MTIGRANKNAICVALLATFFALSAVSSVAQSPAVQTVDAKAIKSLVAQNKGKVVLLNFFATWCPPCRKEFPGIVKFHDKYKAQGLVVLEVSMNDSSERDDILAFIRDQKPPFPIFLAASTDEAFCKAVDERWTTELPVTLIYDRDGKLRYYYPQERTYAELEQDVAPLLSASH